MRPPRGPRRVLWVVEVTKSATGTGLGWSSDSDQPGDVGHVHHEIGPHLPGNLGKAGKIQDAGIGAGPGDDQFGAVLLGQLGQDGEVHLFGLAGPPRRLRP